jgi:large exoprotein involved in heme utilization and adhesion
LFLLNPNGITFGSNAQLNIGGSFIASTASNIRFADGTQFSAVNPQDSSLLSISVPVGLQYGAAARSIVVQGPGNNLSIDPDTFRIVRDERPTGLQVQAGQALALLGGNVTLQGGNLTATNGHIELGSVTSGIVSFDPTQSDWGFSYENAQQFGDVRLSQAASADTSGNGGGSIHVQGRQVRLTDGSGLLAVTQGTSRGRGLSVDATERLQVLGVGSDPESGNVLFPSSLYTDVDLGATGEGGSLSINTPYLQIANGGQVSASTLGAGNSGEITVSARMVELSGGAPLVGGSGLFANVDIEATGASGGINVVADRLSISGGAAVSASTFGSGNAGRLEVAAQEVALSGTSPGGTPSGLFAQVEAGAKGQGGNLRISAQQIRITEGAQVTVNTFGQGSAGRLTIRAGNLELAGNATTIDRPSALLATVQPGATGSGGDIMIRAENLRLLDGAQITVATAGSGNSGNLNIRAQSVELAGGSEFGRSGLFGTAVIGSGRGGTVRVNTDQLSIRDGATISASNFSSSNPDTPPGQGAAGNIQIAAREIQLNNHATITTSSAVGRGGNIYLQSQALRMGEQSRISTNSQGQEPGGNIEITSDWIIASENSDITANAINAQGGRINITTQALLGIQPRDRLTSNNDITATSELGSQFNGVIEIRSPEIDPSQGLVELPAAMTDLDTQIAASCERLRGNEFVITGRGGLPEDASHPLRGQTVWQDLRLAETDDYENVDSKGANSEVIATPPMTIAHPPIVEAQGWIQDETGQIRLVAYSGDRETNLPNAQAAQCQ